LHVYIFVGDVRTVGAAHRSRGSEPAFIYERLTSGWASAKLDLVLLAIDAGKHSCFSQVRTDHRIRPFIIGTRPAGRWWMSTCICCPRPPVAYVLGILATHATGQAYAYIYQFLLAYW